MYIYTHTYILIECLGMIRKRYRERDRCFKYGAIESGLFSWEELQECYQRCLDYAQQSSNSSGQQFIASLSECNLESDVETCMSLSTSFSKDTVVSFPDILLLSHSCLSFSRQDARKF